MQLHRDPLTLHSGLEQMLQQLGIALRRRRVTLRQRGGPDRPLCLRPTRQQRRLAQPSQQFVAEAPAFGGLDPAAEPDPGGGHDDVHRIVEQLGGRGVQLGVIGQRHDPDRRPVPYRRPLADQQRAEFVGTPCRGDAHCEAGKGQDAGGRRFGNHGQICTTPSITRIW